MKIFFNILKKCRFCLQFGCLSLFLGAVQANPINLLVNGSFESGLSGWAVSGTNSGFPVAVIGTDGVTGSAFGEAIPADNVIGGSPDAAGTKGVYFVDDNAHQILSQSATLLVGSYEIGFDAFAPLNGFNNPGDATFSGTIAGMSLASYTVKTQNSPRQWINYSALLNILTDGIYNVTFDFRTFGGASADVVIDRAYIVSSDRNGGTPITTVAEPATLVLLALGLAGLGLFRRQKNNRLSTLH